MATRQPLRSNISHSTPEKITVKGFDLCNDLMGVISLGDMAFLELTDRLPNERESIIFNAISVTLVEHGLSHSAIAARMTLGGAPEAMQAAVAAGLCGLGSVFVGSMEAAARELQSAIPNPASPGDLEGAARTIVQRLIEQKRSIAGIGHRFHKPVDPRAERLFVIAERNEFDGPYVKLMKLISLEAEAALSRKLPVNATGAIAALASELGLKWNIVRGVGVMARAIGLVGHLREEMHSPMARSIKAKVEEEALAHLAED